MSQFFEFYETCFKKDYFSKDSLLICEFIKDLFAEDFFETENINMRFCISINPNVCNEQLYTFPETRALSVTFCGPIEESHIAYDKLKRYIIDHNLTVSGYPREYYLEGEPYGNYDATIIRITVPIAMD